MIRQPPTALPPIQLAVTFSSPDAHVRWLIALSAIYGRDPVIQAFTRAAVHIHSHEWLHGRMPQGNASILAASVILHSWYHVSDDQLQEHIQQQIEALARIAPMRDFQTLFNFFQREWVRVLNLQAPNLLPVVNWINTQCKVKSLSLCSRGCSLTEKTVEEHLVVQLDESLDQQRLETHLTRWCGVRLGELCPVCHERQLVEVNKVTSLPLRLYIPFVRTTPCTIMYELDSRIPVTHVYKSVDQADYELSAIASDTHVWLKKDAETWFRFNLLDGTIEPKANDHTTVLDGTCLLIVLSRVDD